MFSLLADYFWREPFAFVASALGCLTPVFLVIAVHLYRSRNRSIQACQRLRREIENREKLLEKGRALNKDLMARLPHTVWKTAERKRAEGETSGAERHIGEWLATEGDALSRLLLDRAATAYVRAILEDRTTFLACAEGYAQAATALSPAAPEAAAFAAEAAATRKIEGRTLMPPGEAFAAAMARPPTARTSGAFGADLAWAADACERESVMQYEMGRYRLAMAAVDAVLAIRIEMDGPNTPAVMNAKSLKGYILLGLDRPELALPVVRSLAEDIAANPDFGPDHPDTLSYRYQLALVHEAMGQREEALDLAREIVELQTGNPHLGPNHPDTVETRKLLNRLLEQSA